MRRGMPPPSGPPQVASRLCRWRDVSIHPEQVPGVVLRLDFGQACEVLPVRGMGSLLALVRGLEVDVMPTRGERAKALPRCADPGDMPLAGAVTRWPSSRDDHGERGVPIPHGAVLQTLLADGPADVEQDHLTQ